MEISWHITERDFFSGLPEEKKEFLSVAFCRSIEKNEMIFTAGEVGHSAFYLAEGKVRIFRHTPVGKEAIVFIRQAGEMFGLAEVMGRQKRINNAQAITHCKVYEIKAEDFEKILSRHYPLAKRVIEVLGRRLRYLGEQLESLMISDVATRLLRLLACLSYQNLIDTKVLNQPIVVPVSLTQEQMAAMIGSTQQTVSEALKKMKDQGLIAISSKKITLLRPKEVLEQILA